MNYLIIGGAGFIGANFSDLLMKRGDNVTIFDNLSRKGTIENVSWLKERYPNLKMVQSDIRLDFDKLRECVKDTDIIYHLAAQVAVTTSVTNPRQDFEINALGTFNVVEAVRLSENKPILIYASTNKVYGGMEDIKIIEKSGRYEYKDHPDGIPEDRPLDFHSPYGCSKGIGDQYVRDYFRIYGLRTVVMRQSCIYGIRQFGVEDQGWVAWFTIAAALNKPITIYGDGKQIRDVLFVDDLFEAWDLAARYIEVTKGKIYNVGGGARLTLSLLELLNYLEKLTGNKITYSFSDWRPGDQPVYVSDISKTQKEIGWTPKTTVENGVKKLHQWILSNKDLFVKLGF